MTDEEILRIYKKEPYEHGYKMLASTKNEDRSVLSPFALGLAEMWKLGGTDPGGIYVSLVIIAIVEQLFKKNSIEDIKKIFIKDNQLAVQTSDNEEHIIPPPSDIVLISAYRSVETSLQKVAAARKQNAAQ